MKRALHEENDPPPSYEMAISYVKAYIYKMVMNGQCYENKPKQIDCRRFMKTHLTSHG
jgi:hypothetical protein